MLRVIDPLGEQVSDLFAFADGDPACSLSSGRTIDYASKIYLTKGDVLWSNDSRPMFTVLEDDVGRHDFLLTPCSQQMFEILYKHRGHHPSCFENLCNAFEPWGIRPEQISTTFNIFMRVDVAADGTVAVKPPLSRGGRAHRAARRDGPGLRVDGVLGGRLQQRDVQAHRFRDRSRGRRVTHAHRPVVAALRALIDAHGWHRLFQQAVDEVVAQEIPALAAIRTRDDYLAFLDDMVAWAPREHADSLLVHDKLVTFHFLLDQPALRPLQSPAHPGATVPQLTPLSAWIVDFARAWGSYLDTPESARHVDTFRTNPAFRWDDYMAPPSGYLTFNQFFARHAKPGRRPVEALCDDRVLVSPADASFIGQWRVDADSTILVADGSLPLKGLRWSLEQLLAGSPWAARFAGGVVTHSALRTFDYHRWHAPAAATVLEARIIQGRAWLDVQVETAVVDGQASRRIEAVEGTGYQFMQTRGLVALETASGLVACLPVGMAQVSSVVITAEVGCVLRKGEEMGYFQFGGSDFVMVFEAGCAVQLEGRPQAHVQQGRRIGTLGRAA